jgi:hypothetical protein
MTNFPADLNPAMYGSGATNGPFIIWGGSAILCDYSPLGAQVYYSGGHESAAGIPNVQLSLVCDFSSLTWAVRNLPLAPNASSSFSPETGLAADGTPYCPHSYLGLQEVPAAWGGAACGSLASFFWAGSRFVNRVNLIDVSQTVNGYTQLATTQPENAAPERISFRANGAAGGVYPVTVQDRTRKGWWLATNGEVDYTLFLSNTGKIKQYPAVNGNGQDGCLVLCDSLDLLMFIDGGYDAGSYASNSYRTVRVRNLATGAVSSFQTLGTTPFSAVGYAGGSDRNYHAPQKMGLQWVEDLKAIYGLDETTEPPTLVKLAPPVADPAHNAWTWSTVPVQHWPDDANGQQVLQRAQNCVFSKFRYVQSLKAFVYCTAANRRPQVIKI